MELTKSFNDHGGKNRIRFTSQKSRSKRASADIFRHSVCSHSLSTSATAVREKRIHETSLSFSGTRKIFDKGSENLKKLHHEHTVRFMEKDNDEEKLGIGRTAVMIPSSSNINLNMHVNSCNIATKQCVDNCEEDLNDGYDENNEELLLTGGTVFLTELVIAAQRNGSEIFQKLVKDLRLLCKSFAELLHHKETIVDLLCACMLSEKTIASNSGTEDFIWHVVNYATNDVLHLLGVLARELREELYPLLIIKVLPRIINDMLNPPSFSTSDCSHKKGHQSLELDVSHIEAAFRCLSYWFKYNSDHLINNREIRSSKVMDGDDEITTNESKEQPKSVDADILRKYYAKTVCHKREIIRRLACEAYAPLLRKCLNKGLKRHLVHTVKALASSVVHAIKLKEKSNQFENDSFTCGRDEKYDLSKSMIKVKSNAIDGVSSLLFEVARGSPGQIHSKKGRLVVQTIMKCLISYARESTQSSDDRASLALEIFKAKAVYEVASQCLYKLRGHVLRGAIQGGTVARSFADVMAEMHHAFNLMLPKLEMSTSSSSINSYVLGHIIDLIAETINFQDGRLVQDIGANQIETAADWIANSLEALLNDHIYLRAGKILQDQILNYLCSAWKMNQSHPSFASRLETFLPSIVSPKCSGYSVSSETKNASDLGPALYLAQNLLPHLSQKAVSRCIIPALLNAAAFSVQNEGQLDPLILVHTIATTFWPINNQDKIDISFDNVVADSIFSVDAAEKLPSVLLKTKKLLLELCLKDDLILLKGEKKENLAYVGYSSRCIPFLVCLECTGETWGGYKDTPPPTSSRHHNELLINVFRWYGVVMNHLDREMNQECEGEDPHCSVVLSLVLESFSKSAVECRKRLSSSNIISLIEQTFIAAKTHASSLIFLQPKSIWAVKGVAALLSSLEKESALNDRPDETFEVLAPNLAESNHFLRFYTLQILEKYPLRPFITDHADLDLTDDLEEEPSYHLCALERGHRHDSFLGTCDIISKLRIIESIPVTFANERQITSQLSLIEVYARTGKLPIVYAEASAFHMLGLLHVKFSPIWSVAIRVLVALSLAQEGPTWPCIEAALKLSVQKSSSDMNLTPLIPRNNNAAATILNHHEHCMQWETSKGKIVNIFHTERREEIGVVSRHVEVDELTHFQSVWSIMISLPNLTTTKSKIVVKIFFHFMANQFYVFHSDDPDAREINLSGLFDSSTKWSRDELGRISLQKKLESFLKIFSAVNGPQQLFKSGILLQMFIAFLSNPDPKIANLSFACVQRFKLPYLLPYMDFVQPMLKKEGLRDAIAKLDLSVTSDTVDKDHRQSLITIVTRILFGRLSSRGSSSKSSKDAPAAKRAAILSFFSRIGNSEGELNYFVYMMVRPFIPSEEVRQLQTDDQSTSIIKMIQSTSSISAEELRRIPTQRKEGFLNLLSNVISQIGFGVKPFVPTFLNLLLSFCEHTEDVLCTSIQSQYLKIEGFVEDEIETVENSANTRLGRIRTLCFLRLADLFLKFASFVDFSGCGNRLWKATFSSLVSLPNTVINAENPPSLLQLIEKVSSDPKLIPLLYECDDIILSVFKCIAKSTREKVMNLILRIIGNFLNEEESFNEVQSTGKLIILKHIHVLIAQFNERLTSKFTQQENLEGRMNYSDCRVKFKAAEELELNILCCVSELLVKTNCTTVGNINTLENLCALLVSSLQFDSHPNQHLLIRTCNCMIPKLSADAAKLHYHAFSKLLGPNRSNAGIASNEMRQLITSALSAIGDSTPELLLITAAVTDLNALSRSHVDEYDFERMLPVLNSLGASCETKGSWIDLSSMSVDGIEGPRTILPLAYNCFHLLYDSDGVVSRASKKALMCLFTTCHEQIVVNERFNPCKTEGTPRKSWMLFVETVLMPCLKVGLNTNDIAARRSFIQLVSHVAKTFSGYDSPHLYGDLNLLIRDDDEELDFFLNITHVQLHRRIRALQRLRKMISDESISSPSQLFSVQSLGNILLPLAMHPVYEHNAKSEEAYVIEAVATVGVISKQLPWRKYSSTLQSVLNSLGRNSERERYLISVICALTDAFHFSVEIGNEISKVGDKEVNSSVQVEGNGIWRSLKNRIIPKVESFLFKEKTNDAGTKIKSLRSSVALTLMKLFQKLPTMIFESKLPQLITVVCSALKNKTSNERDVARQTLAKMAASLDLKYLPLILSELTTSLSEGYKLHVRSATLHSILVEISKVYLLPEVDSLDENGFNSFDRCVPAMLDLIHQDIFGKASEIKEAENVEKRLIKEAMGSKSLNSLEIISTLIHFQPSVATKPVKGEYYGLPKQSVVHAVVTPFLQRLINPEALPSTIKKVKECLNRIAVGFSNNPSAKFDEILPFVYATVSPFILHVDKNSSAKDADLDSSDEDTETPLKVSASNSSITIVSARRKKKQDLADVVMVSMWAPSSFRSDKSQSSAMVEKMNQKQSLLRVSDGTLAPKLTGKSRHIPLATSTETSLNNPANACAVNFGLTLLNTSLKRSKPDISNDIVCSMADPFLPLLTRCVQSLSDSNTLVLSLRSLGVLLRMDLPSVAETAKVLGSSVLNHLTAWGAASNTQSDVVQGCFRALTLLMSHPMFSTNDGHIYTESSHTMSTSEILNSKHSRPLSSDQMEALISLLLSAVGISEHQSATFGLVKCILTKKFVSPHFYDLMEVILCLSVQSQHHSVRMQCSQIFIQYLIEYPMGKQRRYDHLQQITLNIKYEHEEGRLSALDLLRSVIQKFSRPIIEDYSQLFFLPLVLQLVNDESNNCKEKVTNILSLLLKRLTTETVQVYFQYLMRWSRSTGDDSLVMRQASSQILSILIESRLDFVKRGTNASDIVSAISIDLRKQASCRRDDGWEILYYNLLCVEKLGKLSESSISLNYEIWDSLIKFLAYPHPLVMQVSTRVINNHLNTLDPQHFLMQRPDSFVAKIRGCLFEIARNLCSQLDVEDEYITEAISNHAVKTISWVFQSMYHHPTLCYTDETNIFGKKDEKSAEGKSKDPCKWVMTRLYNIAKPKSIKRRESVFKCYAALCNKCDPKILIPYLELMIESADRTIREQTNELQQSDNEQAKNSSSALPNDLLNFIENMCGTEKFLEAYAKVNIKARLKRDQRKQEIASEAVHDPVSAAKRKIKKHAQEKERKKRRIDDRRSMRGALKRKHI